MANTSHTEMVVQGSNFAVLLPCTLDANGAIDGLDTAIVHEATAETTIDPATSATSKTEYVTSALENGVTVQLPKVTKTIDATTGTETSASGSDSGNKISFTTLEVSNAAYTEIVGKASAGTLLFVCVGMGKSTTGGNDGYAFMLGKISANPTRVTKGNDFSNVKVELSAATAAAAAAFTEADLNASTAFGIGVEPMGDTAITAIIHAAATSNVFDADDLTELLAGKLVFKAA